MVGRTLLEAPEGPVTVGAVGRSSLSLIVPVPLPSAMVAPVGLDSCTVNVSADSSMTSPIVETEAVF